MKRPTRPPCRVDRRHFLTHTAATTLGLGAVALLAAAGPDAHAAPAGPGAEAATRALRAGGCAVLLRHARTVAGTGDPPGYDVAVCSTQRNLSDEGREQSRRIGAWFRGQGLAPTAVRSSPWCRCLDTGRLAFEQPATEAWAPLGSTFAERRADGPRQTAELRQALAALQGRPGFEMWVTHMVNIQDLAGVTVAMGEALVVRAQGARVEVLAQWRPGG